MEHTSKLSKLMRMSWEIQKRKKSSRSKSLTAAWAILSNEDITVYYLVKRLNPNCQIKPKALNQFSLFTR